MFYGKLNALGAKVAKEIAEPIVGPVRVTTDLIPSGSRFAAIKFKKLHSSDPDWGSKLAALRAAKFSPDVLHTYGAYVCDTAFVGAIGPANGN